MIDESKFECSVEGTGKVWDPITIKLTDEKGNDVQAECQWMQTISPFNTMIIKDFHQKIFVPCLIDSGLSMLVTINPIPDHYSYTGMPFLKKIGVIKPPNNFKKTLFSKIKKQIKVKIMDLSVGYCVIKTNGPYVKIVQSGNVLKKLDFRKKTNLLIRRNDGFTLIISQNKGKEETKLVFTDIVDRDVKFYELGVWKTYWESLASNKDYDSEIVEDQVWLSSRKMILGDKNFFVLFQMMVIKLKEELNYHEVENLKKSIEQKKEIINQSKTREAGNLKKIRTLNSKIETMDKEFYNSRRELLALEEEKNFFLHKAVDAEAKAGMGVESIIRAKKEKKMKEIEEEMEAMVINMRTLKDENIEQENEILKLNREIKYLKKMWKRAQEENQVDMTSPLDVTQNTEMLINIVNLEKENEELKNKIKKQDREMLNQLATANSTSIFNTSDSNLKLANMLVNKLTEELTKRDEEIDKLKNELKGDTENILEG